MKKTIEIQQAPIIATFLFSFDTLTFVLGRIAILDIFTLTFMLLGFYWYFTGHSYSQRTWDGTGLSDQDHWRGWFCGHRRRSSIPMYQESREGRHLERVLQMV